MAQVRMTPRVIRDARCHEDLPKVNSFDMQQHLAINRDKTSVHNRSIRHVDAAANSEEDAQTPSGKIGCEPLRKEPTISRSPQFEGFIIDQYLPNVKCFKRSWRTDETLLRMHAFPVLARQHLDEIGPSAITLVVQRMQEKCYASGTINRVLAVIRRAFNLARKWQVTNVGTNPAAELSVGPDILRNRFLSSEETQRLITSLQADQNRMVANAILLLLLTGARRNEITYAKWEYVNWERKTLFVPVKDCPTQNDCSWLLGGIALEDGGAISGKRLHLSVSNHWPAFAFLAFSVGANQSASRAARIAAA